MNSPSKTALGWDEDMKYGKREFGGASLEVLQCKGLPEKMQKGTREILNVITEPDERGKGHATALMEAVCREADSKKMILMLSPDPYGDDAPLTRAQLLAWYVNKFHFNPIQHEPLILARMYDPYYQPVLAKKIGQIITEGF